MNLSGKPKDANQINQLVLVGKRKGGVCHWRKLSVEHRLLEVMERVTVDDTKDPQLLTNFAKDLGGQIDFDLYQQSPISLKGMETIQSTGTQTHSMNRWIEPRDRYFAIICSQYPADSRHSHHVSNGYLALECEVQWPYKVFDPSNRNSSDSLLTNAREIEERFRTKFTFPVAISR